jgi:hypothetical protein
MIENITEVMEESDGPLKTFLDLIKRSNKPCPDDDCKEIVCPTCGGKLDRVFGSLPLKVFCEDCSGEFPLRDLVMGDSDE